MAISDRLAVMHAGRIQQLGAPAEVYEQPATEFVAAFVGAVNALEGEVTARAPDGGATVRTPVGPLEVRGLATGIQPGTAVRLMIRPEAVRLLPPGEAGRPNTVAGKVEDATYTGALVRYGVVAGGVRLAANLHDPRRARVYREGDPVALELPADVHVLPAG